MIKTLLMGLDNPECAGLSACSIIFLKKASMKESFVFTLSREARFALVGSTV